jgi:DNA polymerase III subunit epsilon
MESDSLINSLGTRLRPNESSLTDKAVAMIARGPISSAELVAEVCSAIGIRYALAEQLARAILGHRPDVRQGPDGRWRSTAMHVPRPLVVDAPLAPDTVAAVAAPRAIARDSAAELAIDDLKFAVVDVETTGGRPSHGDRITEIAIVQVHNGTIGNVYETLVNPECRIPQMITQITRITSAMVRDKPVFANIAHDVLERLHGHIFVAHNANFDWRFVSHELYRATGRTLDGTSLCTVKLARKVLPQLPRRNLDSVSRHYAVEIPPETRHRAAGDAIATAKVLLSMLRDLRDRDVVTWGALDALQRGGTAAAKSRRRSQRSMPSPVKSAADGA